MTENIIEEPDLIITRFWGGIDRGSMLQINVSDKKRWKHIQISLVDFNRIAKELGLK